MLDSLAPRGEIPEAGGDDALLAGVQRLPIVDRDHAVQPWIGGDGRWVLCYNGEIFNTTSYARSWSTWAASCALTAIPR